MSKAQDCRKPEQSLTQIELDERGTTEEEKTRDFVTRQSSSSAISPVMASGTSWKGEPLVEASRQESSPTIIVQQSTPTHARTSLPHLSSSSSLYPHSFSTYSSTTSILADSGYGSLATSCSSEQLKSGMKKHSSQMSFGSAASSRQVSCGNLPLDDFLPPTLAEDSIAEDEDETSFEDTGAQEEQLQDTSFRECTEATEVSTESEHPFESKLIAGTTPPLLQELRKEWKEEMKEEMKEELKLAKVEMKEYFTHILQEKLDNMKLESSSVSSFSEPSPGKAPTMECKTCTGSPHSSECPDTLTSSHPCPLLEEKGVQTPENLRRLPSRLHSDSEYMKRVMLRRKPKLSDLQKAHSASDAEDAMTMQKLVGGYHQLPGIKDDQQSMVELEEQCQAAANTESLDEAVLCVDEDLTEEELLTIAGHVHPDILCPLAVGLHKNTKHYLDIMHRFAHVSATDKAFKILCAWFQDISPGPENRRRLVEEFCKLKQRRVASVIAIKDYTTLK